jgi:hypothetical protein
MLTPFVEFFWQGVPVTEWPVHSSAIILSFFLLVFFDCGRLTGFLVHSQSYFRLRVLAGADKHMDAGMCLWRALPLDLLRMS